MAEKNVNQRLLIIGLALLLAVLFLRDPRQTLQPGLDIAGGTSLIYEIDTTGAESDPQLAERVKQHLQRRVDPKGVYDLAWRVHGSNRIEVQMPLPSRDAKQRLEEYRTALDKLFEPRSARGESESIHTITRGLVERALRAAGDQQAALLEQLARRNTDDELAQIEAFERAQALQGEAREDALAPLREEIGQAGIDRMAGEDLDERRAQIEAAIDARRGLLEEARKTYEEYLQAKNAYDAYVAARDATTQPATAPADDPEFQRLEIELRDAQEFFDDSVEQVLNSNLNRRRFQEVLDLDAESAVREASLEDLREKHPDLRNEMAHVIAAHATWRSNRRFLEGPGDLKRLLHGSGRLEFRILAEPNPDNPTQYDRYRRQLTTEGVTRRPQDEFGWFKVDNAMQFFNLESEDQLESLRQTYKQHDGYVIEILGQDFYVLGKTTGRPEDVMLHDQPGMREWKLTRADPDRDRHGRPCVRFVLDPVGGGRFYRLTRENIDRPLCILVDDVAYSAPNINSPIRRSGVIEGEFSQQKIAYLVRTMEGGTLPARLKDTPLSERTIGSSLGEANRDAAVRAGLLGGAAVLVVMLLYYLIVCGSIANVALLLNVLFILAAMAMLSARITLVGIAGIILSVGMAVDANVLIFERMREEKERGTSLRMIIKNGYDKALSTIVDANITTLLTCIIIYYVGSEEVKGFGLTLGWGIVLNLFTSVFVTRTLFALLLKYNLIKDVKMLKIIGVPNIDWYSKRKIFLPISAAIVVIGLFLLYERGREDTLDVEFLGGVAAEFELRESGLEDTQMAERLAEVGAAVSSDGEKLAEATLEPVPEQPNAFVVSVPDVSASRLAALIAEPLQDQDVLERNGVEVDRDANKVTIYLAGEVTREDALQKIHGLVQPMVSAGSNLEKVNINAVLDVPDVEEEGLVWNLTTTVTNMRLVEHALTLALGDNMRIQPRIEYTMHDENGRPFPIDDRLLQAVVPSLPPGATYDLTDYLGGVAIDLDDLDPPQAIESFRTRLDNMHFQPDFQDQPKRRFDVIGVERAEGRTDDVGNPLYRRLIVVAVDPDIRYTDDPDQWYAAVAAPQIKLVTAALESEQTLRKVMQFKPQIAARSTRQASTALLLSWVMIIAYLWIRFGKPTYGVAGVTALVHDVLIALAFVGISGWLGGKDHPIGEALLISDFKINMTVVAALLTIIGYSINDTIVVFDRIRETRGRLGVVSPEIINASINQTLARTLMTSATTLIVLLIMYIVGGSSIRGFSFCMIIGILTGSYSSIAVASPLLMARFLQPKTATR